MRLKPVFLSSLAIFTSQTLFSSPNIKYWSDFGVVPIQLNGKSQTIVRPFTLCRDPDANFPLIAWVDLQQNSGEWRSRSSTYKSYSPDLCQTISLHLTPKSIGQKQVEVQLTCYVGVADCGKDFTATADVVSELEYKQRLAQSLIDVGRQSFFYNDYDHVVTNIASTFSGNKLWVGNAYKTRILNIDPDSLDLLLSSTNNLATGLEESLLCSDTDDTFIDFARHDDRVRRRNIAGDIIAESQEIVLNHCGSIQSSHLRLVPVRKVPDLSPVGLKFAFLIQRELETTGARSVMGIMMVGMHVLSAGSWVWREGWSTIIMNAGEGRT